MASELNKLNEYVGFANKRSSALKAQIFKLTKDLPLMPLLPSLTVTAI
jgi:hypothetical protein